MPYDPETQRLYQREWIKKKLEQWVEAHGPCASCGSPDNLKKVRKTYSSKRRSASVRDQKGYMVLCEPCTKKKIAKSFKRRYTGTGRTGKPTKLDEQKVRDIVEMVQGGISMRRVAKMMGIDHSTISAIMSGKIWKHVLKPPSLNKKKRKSVGNDEEE